MKKFFFALIISAPAFAAEVVVMDIPARDLLGATRIETRFDVNEAAGTVDAKMRATETFTSCIGGPIGYPGPYYPYPDGHYGGNYDGYYRNTCMSSERELMTVTEEIAGMTVVDKVVSINGTVCGKMGLSRVFKIPTFFMNGKCKLAHNMTRVNGEKRLLVKLLTK
jgi:hypothetical protein